MRHPRERRGPCSLGTVLSLLVAPGLAASAPTVARGSPGSSQASFLPPVDPGKLAGRILFAFGDAGLLLPPSRVEKDGSLAEVRLGDAQLEAGVQSVVSLLFPTGTLYGLGDVHGAASPQGLKLAGRLSLVPGSAFALDDGTVVTTAGSMSVRVESSRFRSADLRGVSARASLSVGGGKLELQGTLGDGRYDGGPVSLNGTLSLVKDFETQTGAGGTVRVRLKAGGTLDVDVKAGSLESATFASDPADVRIVVPLAKGPLVLIGRLSGRYKDYSLDFDGSLTLSEDFTYQRGPVTATLSSGGTVQVTVQDDDLRGVDLEGIGATVVIHVEDRPLRLHGTISAGAYVPDRGVSLRAELELDDPFVYHKGPVQATLTPGPTAVQMHGGGGRPWVLVQQPGRPALKVDLVPDDDEDDDK